MTARLQRFFGGDPAFWLMACPISLLWSYIRMLPRLQAEDTLLAVEAVALGTGAMEKNAARRRFAMLDRQRHAAPARQAPSPAQLAALGIQVVAVEPQGSA